MDGKSKRSPNEATVTKTVAFSIVTLTHVDIQIE